MADAVVALKLDQLETAELDEEAVFDDASPKLLVAKLEVRPVDPEEGSPEDVVAAPVEKDEVEDAVGELLALVLQVEVRPPLVVEEESLAAQGTARRYPVARPRIMEPSPLRLIIPPGSMQR